MPPLGHLLVPAATFMWVGGLCSESKRQRENEEELEVQGNVSYFWPWPWHCMTRSLTHPTTSGAPHPCRWKRYKKYKSKVFRTSLFGTKFYVCGEVEVRALPGFKSLHAWCPNNTLRLLHSSITCA